MLLLVEQIRHSDTRVHHVARRAPRDWMVMLVDAWVGVALLATDNLLAQFSGIGFLALAALVGTALLMRRRRMPYRRYRNLICIAQLLGPGLYTCWGVLYFISGLLDQSATLAAAGAFMYIAYRHAHCPAARIPGQCAS